MAPRYLILGASGFVGAHLYAALGQAKAIATYHSKPLSGGISFDAATMRLADAVLRGYRGLTHAFILHGVTAIDTCARDPAGTARINVAGTQRVIDDLVEHGITPVFASSDAVFDGSRGLWSENDSVNPILTYGRQKVEVERYLLEKAESPLVLRLAKVVSETAGAKDLLGNWLNQLESGESIPCARDQVFSPVTVNDAVEAFVRLAQDGQTGIVHVCGPRPVSRLELLQMLVEEARCHRDLSAQIIPCSIRDFSDFAETRPFNTSMSPTKLYAALGRSFNDPRETCRRVAAARYAGQTIAQREQRSNAH
jgi:dTDP-4-dehydrorhamnose reductase